MIFNKKILAFLLIPTFILLYMGGVNQNYVFAGAGIALLVVNTLLNIIK